VLQREDTTNARPHACQNQVQHKRVHARVEARRKARREDHPRRAHEPEPARADSHPELDEKGDRGDGDVEGEAEGPGGIASVGGVPWDGGFEGVLN
jgi:hypothetical protein